MTNEIYENQLFKDFVMPVLGKQRTLLAKDIYKDLEQR